MWVSTGGKRAASAEARAEDDEAAPAGPAEQPSFEWAPAGTAPNQNRNTSLQARAAIVGKVKVAWTLTGGKSIKFFDQGLKYASLLTLINSIKQSST